MYALLRSPGRVPALFAGADEMPVRPHGRSRRLAAVRDVVFGSAGTQALPEARPRPGQRLAAAVTLAFLCAAPFLRLADAAFSP